MKKNKITQIHGAGMFVDAGSLEVEDPAGGRHRIGAAPRLLPGTSRSERVVTYEEQILSGALPRSIVIVGAGAIGVEFAYVLRNYGVEVTIVEFLDRMLPLEDEEVSAELQQTGVSASRCTPAPEWNASTRAATRSTLRSPTARNGPFW